MKINVLLNWNLKTIKSKTALYRHYGANDVLLYVGISLSATARLAQHSTSAPWYEDIQRVNIEYFDTRAMAQEAEKNAIIYERPLFNKAYYKHKYRIPANIPYEKLSEIMEGSDRDIYYVAFRTYDELEAFNEGYKQYLNKKRKYAVRQAYLKRINAHPKPSGLSSV